MARIPYDHFALLIFGQGLWKESFTKKISKDTKSSFFHLSGYTKDSLFCTCPVCNALIKLFDPMKPDEYLDRCDLCIPLYQQLEKIKGSNEGMILLSHNGIRELELLQNLTSSLLSNEKIKKIYVLEVEYKKIEKEVPLIIQDLKHQRLPKSEFISLLENKMYNYRVIYEIFKDKYY
jgi:hypothetical protein